ncbi:MAG: hypothetical protein B6241_12500 [Spirochaetaceae bacterium 4572_59]|nr:MAG: hypothetical protein B6241_12500 [Spirochaetaceae bacterium 4572_59]
MPRKAKRPCSHVGCPRYATEGSSRCEIHQTEVQYKRRKPRPSYLWNSDSEWKRIRIETLKAHNIPESQWKDYVIDHRPPYDPRVEPDHRNYTLVPMTRGEHSKKTNRYDGGWGNRKKSTGGGGIKSL